MSDETTERHDPGATAQDDGGAPSLDRVETLMAERRKYESWLETLEARRATTPEHVFARVHGDYHDRLDAVIQQLKEHTDGLQAEVAALTSRLTSLEAEQQQRRDERAEAELRAHVGELSAEAWQGIAGEADNAIESLSKRHAELERERARTRELLTEAERPPTPRGGPAVTARVVAPAAAAAPAASAPPAAPEAPPRETPVPPLAIPPAVIAAEAALADARAAEEAERREADVTPAPTQRADASRVSGQTANTFDELAFLSSVVDTPASASPPSAGAPPEERPRRDSYAQRATHEDIVNLANDPASAIRGPSAAERGAASPLAMNVSGNNPIVIKEKSTETAKTLKCGECGAMNYPTEWYCERCGAELASL